MKGIDYFSQPGAAIRYFTEELSDSRNITITTGVPKMILAHNRHGFSRKDHILLDIGCGYGNLIDSMVATLGFTQVVGIDGSQEMLELLKLQSKAATKKASVKTLCLDIESEDIPLAERSVSVVTCLRTVLYLSSLENLFSKIEKIIKHNGTFFFNAQFHNGDTLTKKSLTGVEFFIHSEKLFTNLVKKFNFNVEPYSISGPVKKEGGEYICEKFIFLKKMKA